MKPKFNLPKKVIFCKKCLMSNQRPSSIAEFKHTKNRKGAKYLKTWALSWDNRWNTPGLAEKVHPWLNKI